MEHTMPKVLDCTMESCAYNQNKTCHAMAITIGDTPTRPACDTFIETGQSGGFSDMTASVGACKASACMHNQNLECMADNIHVTNNPSHTACCSTFKTC